MKMGWGGLAVGGGGGLVGGFLRESNIETVRANELDLLKTWHSAHGTRSISLLCRKAG